MDQTTSIPGEPSKDSTTTATTNTTTSNVTETLPSATATKLVVFDYDWSLIDANSDTWILEQLSDAAVEKVKRDKGQTQWTRLMHEAVQQVQQDGIHHTDILAKVADVPVETEMIDAIKLAHECGAYIAILSDANTLYIEAFLVKHGLDKLVHTVVTNHAIINDKGLLEINPYHAKDVPPHGCRYCPVNLCKGRELEGVIIPRASAAVEMPDSASFDQIIYVGDGSGDFCPSRKLRETDLLLVRDWDERPSARGLVKRLQKYPGEIGSRIEYFKTARDILSIFSREFVAPLSLPSA